MKKSSFIFIPHDFFDPPFVYCCSFSSRKVNKTVDFCYEKVYVSLYIQLRSFEIFAKYVREKATKCS